MNLDQLAVNARLRNGWEALDLGVVLARRWYKPLLLLWLVPSLLVAIPLVLALWSQPLVAYFVIWWLKPLWERLPLYWASRAMFGEHLPVRDVLSKIGPLYLRDTLPWLLWRRFSPTRGFDMPVTVLENLTGEPRQKRLGTLHIRNTGAAMGAMFACANFEMILCSGMIFFAMLMVPAQMDIPWQDMALLEDYALLAPYYLLLYLAYALVAPFYVMACFTLYLSRRIELEAWDIELTFRQLNARLEKTEKRKIGTSSVLSALTAVLLMAAVLGIGSVSGPVYAEAAETPAQSVGVDYLSPAESRKKVQAILDGDEFNRTGTARGWRLKRDEITDDPEDRLIPQWLIRLIEWFEENGGFFHAIVNFFGGFSGVIKWLLVVTGISLVLWVLWQYRDVAGQIGGNKRRKRSQDKPETLFGLEVTVESLPERVSDSVLTMWRRGEHRDALALLYRATLSKLMHQHDVQFHEGMTEGECLKRVEQSASDGISSSFARLTAKWVNLAYGHRLPAADEVDILCQDYEQYVNNTAAGSL